MTRIGRLVAACLVSATLLPKIVGATPPTESVPVDAPPTWRATAPWQEMDGPTAFTAHLQRLLTAYDSDVAQPLVRESGPAWQRGAAPDRPVLDVDLEPMGVVTTGWRAPQLPAPLFEYHPAPDDVTRGRWRLATGGIVTLPEGFTLHGRLLIDSETSHDPTARTPNYRQLDATLEIRTAALSYRRGGFMAQVLRGWQRWGPGWTGSLILDASHPPGDGFALAYGARRWSLRYNLMRMDEIDMTVDGTTRTYLRYLAAHRLDGTIGRNLRFGLTETAIIAALGAPPFWALNPLLPWALTQQEQRGDAETANVMWALDLVWNPHHSWSLYGQALLDDFMLDSADRPVHPDRLGWLAGFVWRPRLAPRHTDPDRFHDKRVRTAAGEYLTLGGEYTRIATWTYINRSPLVHYRAWSAPLGHPSGPDGESFTGFATLDLKPSGARSWLLVLWGRWYRHGRIRIDTTEVPASDAGRSFPTEPVASWNQFGLVATVPGPMRSTLELRAGWIRRSVTADNSATAVATDADWSATGGDWWGGLFLTVPLGPWRANL